MAFARRPDRHVLGAWLMRPDVLVQQLLQQAFPGVPVEVGKISRLALSEPRYIFVEAVSGTAPHPGRLHLPSVVLIVYGRGTHVDVQKFAYEVQQALYSAWLSGTTVPEGYLARLRVSTLPYAQGIPGLPSGVHRFRAQYTLGTRPSPAPSQP